MERVRRQAANPLRVILEASKARRKPGETDAAGTSDLAGLRKANARTAPVAAAGTALESASARAPQAAAGASAPPAVPRAPSAEPTPVETRITLSSAVLQAQAQTEPTLAIEPVAPASAPRALPVPASALPLALSATPRLVKMVEPILSARAIEEAGGLRELSVDLVIRADGSVAEVRLALKLPRQLVRAVESALEQWRFEPLSGERVHRVQLVFDTAGR